MTIAKENLEAARELHDAGRHRSACSRAYYSAFAAVHALGIHTNQSLPSRGNWSNKRIRDVANRGLQHVKGKPLSKFSKSIRDNLATLWSLRIQADYSALSTVNAKRSKESRRAAGQVVNGIRSLI